MADIFELDDKLNMDIARECALSFSISTNLGCAISDLEGQTLYSVGYSCSSCLMSPFIKDHSTKVCDCSNTHMYGMLQAQRFGGKYIYFCPVGYNFLVSPILDEEGPIAYVKAGPFLMVDKDDYIKYDICDMLKVPSRYYEDLVTITKPIPNIEPDKVTKFSNLLYFSMGFVSNISSSNKMIRNQNNNDIQDEIGEILFALKASSADRAFTYPFETEVLLSNAIKDSNRHEANRYLNDLLGSIFFYTGGNIDVIRSRLYELLVLMSRAAIDGGADPTHVFELNSRYFVEIHSYGKLDDLCVWLVDVMNRFTDYVFRFNDVKHVEVIRKSVDYIRQNYQNKITLDEVAAYVYLSPSYFSKIFKDEMELNFNAYLNKIRIEKSKQFLLSEKIKLVDVAGMVGFEDQSYFSKVFKKLTGVTPGKFRESRGKVPRDP